MREVLSKVLMDVYVYQYGAFIFDFLMVAWPACVLRKYGTL